LAKLKLFGESHAKLPAVTKAVYDARNHDAVSVLKKYSNEHQFDLIDTLPIFCQRNECIFTNDQGQALFEDDNHLNYLGAQMLVQPIFQKIATSH
jgi:hypothetical protein